MNAVYGTKQQRVNWKHARGLLYALISKECLGNFTWSGKGKRNQKTKHSFRTLDSFHRLFLETLQKIDSSYNHDIYNDNMKHIFKRTYENIIEHVLQKSSDQNISHGDQI